VDLDTNDDSFAENECAQRRECVFACQMYTQSNSLVDKIGERNGEIPITA